MPRRRLRSLCALPRPLRRARPRPHVDGVCFDLPPAVLVGGCLFVLGFAEHVLVVDFAGRGLMRSVKALVLLAGVFCQLAPVCMNLSG